MLIRYERDTDCAATQEKYVQIAGRSGKAVVENDGEVCQNLVWFFQWKFQGWWVE